MTGPASPWAIVVPVKRLAVAKSRLAVDPPARAQLALAMALDTVAAARACDRVVGVVAVCDDEQAVPLLREAGAVVVADEPDAGLNPALVHGADVAAAMFAGQAIAALSSDLPALRAVELGAALAAAAGHRLSVVADGPAPAPRSRRPVADDVPAVVRRAVARRPSRRRRGGPHRLAPARRSDVTSTPWPTCARRHGWVGPAPRRHRCRRCAGPASGRARPSTGLDVPASRRCRNIG